MALGDPVFRGDVKVGVVNALTWERAKDGLEIEFDPEPIEFDANGRAVGRCGSRSRRGLDPARRRPVGQGGRDSK